MSDETPLTDAAEFWAHGDPSGYPRYCVKAETARALERRCRDLEDALRGIMEIGKRDMSNPKYDAYFDSARAALERSAE